tara:strand:+ start:2036 stop:3121 length:1086 start_codon:yes stop_codon:yes gene_type:complete
MSKVVILYSSFNNYELLKNEVLKRVDFNKNAVINVDDFSNEKNINDGRKICKDNNIVFLKNESKGVQSAVETCVKYCNENIEDCEWIFCLQQDFFPLGKNFFNKFERIVERNNLKNLGAIGFNCLDKNSKQSYTFDSYKDYLAGKKVKGYLGSFFLSDSKKQSKRMSLFYRIAVLIYSMSPFKKYRIKAKEFSMTRRVFGQKAFHKFNKTVQKYEGNFSIELPIWAGVAINKKKWEQFIKINPNYIFHLWFPDVAMQFLSQNINLGVISDLSCHNEITIKEKYGMSWSSVDAGKNKESDHVEAFGYQRKVFYDAWGFEFENIQKLYEKKLQERYKDTLVLEYFNHDCRKGPLYSFNFDKSE